MLASIYEDLAISRAATNIAAGQDFVHLEPAENFRGGVRPADLHNPRDVRRDERSTGKTKQQHQLAGDEEPEGFRSDAPPASRQQFLYKEGRAGPAR